MTVTVVAEGLDLSVLVVQLLSGSSSLFLSNSIKLGICSNFHREGTEAVVDVEVGLLFSQGRGVPPLVSSVDAVTVSIDGIKILQSGSHSSEYM